jgi:pyrroloquinoline-quinone synthase
MTEETTEGFVERLRAAGAARYHDKHPFHVRMLAGACSKEQLEAWVENRFYYQTRIPIKDAIILSKSEDPTFRRLWIRRIHDHDGDESREGGIAQRLRLAEGVGLDRRTVASHVRVVPAVRFACDAYVSFVRERSLVEAVASSLTEFFAPEHMTERLSAWEKHYRHLIDPACLEYFRSRPPRARRDSSEALAFVVEHATTTELRDRCVAALITKCEILWALLDGVALAAPA